MDRAPGAPDDEADVLILDDLGLVRIGEPERHDLLEILEDRNGLRATIVTSQFPVAAWHDTIGDPTVADAILDRLVHRAHRLELKGKTMRDKDKANPREDADD